MASAASERFLEDVNLIIFSRMIKLNERMMQLNRKRSESICQEIGTTIQKESHLAALFCFLSYLILGHIHLCGVRCLMRL